MVNKNYVWASWLKFLTFTQWHIIMFDRDLEDHLAYEEHEVEEDIQVEKEKKLVITFLG